MSQTNNTSIWPILIGAAFLGTFVQTIAGCDTGAPATSSNYTPAPAGVDRSSFEHRYAKERVKLEGYSDKEAQQAADAITKFHNAQKNR
jgi:hypothetical protein